MTIIIVTVAAAAVAFMTTFTATSGTDDNDVDDDGNNCKTACYFTGPMGRCRVGPSFYAADAATKLSTAA